MLAKGALLPLGSVTLTFALAIALAKLARVKRQHFGLFCASVANSNTIFIGIPVNLALFGEGSIPYVLLYYAASTVFFWTVGVYSITCPGLCTQPEWTFRNLLKTPWRSSRGSRQNS